MARFQATFGLLITLLVTFALQAQTTVFVNEIHYDNAGGDLDEGVEIAGPAGTDLTGWSIALYNGSSSQLNVYDTINLSGTIPDQQSGFGTIMFLRAGIQNGAPDGIALVDNGSTVVQFLSYEGSFTAASGPAAGLNSVDIGVSESSGTPVGFSLQLGGTGSEYEDFSWNAEAAGTYNAVNNGQSFAGGGVATNVRINEVDADTPSSDVLEFVELFDGGVGNTALDGLVVVFFNGSDDASYAAFDLDGFSTDSDGFFVLGNSGVANVDLVFSNGLLQNGADAVAVYAGDASEFPNDTPVTASNIIDAIVYDTDDADDLGLVDVLTPGQSQINENGAGDKDNHSNSRVPDGGSPLETSTYVQQVSTPGTTNVLPPPIVINEVDANTPGIDDMEFVELYDGGIGNTSLDGLVIVFFNGSDDASYEAFDLDGFSTNSSGFFVLGNAGVTNVGLVFPDNALQNGADAVALYTGDATDFPNDTPVTTNNLLDALVYDTDDADDPGLLPLLNAGQPQVNENGQGDEQNHSNSRFPDGGVPRDTDTYVQQAPTPGETNVIAPDVVINEVDSDTPSSDTLEFVELYDGGTGNTSLDGLVIVFYNGSDDASYQAFDLDGFTTDASGFFVLGNAGVANVDFIISNGSLQNGADAVALHVGNASDFPNDTPVTTNNLVDALVYDTDDADDAGLLILLNGGQPQVNEGGQGDKDNHSNARLPDGGIRRNTDTYVQQTPTPGISNIIPPNLTVNEVDADTPGSDNLEFIELYDEGVGNSFLDGHVVVLFNGSSDASYAAFDLDGFRTNSRGFFVLGNAAVDSASLIFADGTLQNGADAVAVYTGDAADFPNGTPVTTTNLVDALVYDTDDADDAGLLVLLNTGQPQINENGLGDKDGHSNSRFPNGGIARNTDTYVQQAPTPGRTNNCVEIFTIQGPGLSSPFAGQAVKTADNVVTGVAVNGFFMQTPTARSDGDEQTSDGIFVFTSAPPSVGVGDFVNVEGDVVEFFGSTQISNTPTVLVVSSGNPLPSAVIFDENTPSPNQPQPDNEIERYEGMLVQISGGTSTGPSDDFNNFTMVAGPDRTFREPGIEFPGLPGLPVWDGNPEILEVNPNGIGLPDTILPAGAEITSVSGPLTFSFGEYQIMPSSLSFTNADLVARPVRAAESNEVTIATQNLERLSLGQTDRLSKFSMHIRNVLQAPDILAVQEVDSVATLQALADKINMDDPGLSYTAFVEKGNGQGNINIGFLVKNTVQVDSVIQIGKDVIFDFNNTLLFDRPPLVLEGDFLNGGNTFPITVMAIHNRSLLGIAGNDSTRIRLKRHEQALWISQEVQTLQTMRPDIHLVVTGDFNAYEFTDGYVDVVGQISGDLDPLGAFVPGTDEVEPDLTNQVLSLPAEERYSFIFEGTAQAIDHMLTSHALRNQVVEVQFGRGNADMPAALEDAPSTSLRSADHDGLVLYINTVDEIANTVVFATNSVWVRQNADLISGNILVNDASSGQVLDSGVELSVGKNTTTAPDFVFKADGIKVKQGAVVDSDLEYNELTNNGTINGATVPSLSVPLLSQLPSFNAAPAGVQDVVVAQGDSIVLAAGDYGDITIKRNGIILFAGSIYNIRSLDAGQNTKLLFGQAAEIRIEEKFDTARNSFIGPDAAASIDADAIIFYVAGINGTSGNIGATPKAAAVGQDNTLLANFYVPNGTLWIKQGGDATGAFWARDVKVGLGVQLTVSSFFKSADVTLNSPALSKSGQRVIAENKSQSVRPERFSLAQNYPNPFNPETSIRFEVPEASHVVITIYNALGQKLTTLVNQEYSSGSYRVVWNGRNGRGLSVASGLYIYQIEAGSFRQTKKMLLLR